LTSEPRIGGGAGPVPTSYSHRRLAQNSILTKGGTVRIAGSTTFPAATTIAAAFVEVEAGGMREIHWHPTADEMQYAQRPSQFGQRRQQFGEKVHAASPEIGSSKP
jgi:hypothetical protein